MSGVSLGMSQLRGWMPLLLGRKSQLSPSVPAGHLHGTHGLGWVTHLDSAESVIGACEMIFTHFTKSTVCGKWIRANHHNCRHYLSTYCQGRRERRFWFSISSLAFFDKSQGILWEYPERLSFTLYIITVDRGNENEIALCRYSVPLKYWLKCLI